MKNIIVSCVNNDDTYLKQAYVMLRSISVTNPNQEVELTLLNCPSYLNKMYCFNKNIRVYNHDIIDTGCMKKMAASYRSILVLKALEKYKVPVMWLDSDIIVRKSFDKFWEAIHPNTFRVVKRDTNDISCKFNSGFFCLGFSQFSVSYMKDYYSSLYLKKKWKDSWPADQRYLWLCYGKYSKSINLLPLKENEHDFSFLEDSLLWHSKSARFNDPRFQLYFKKHLKGFNYEN